MGQAQSRRRMADRVGIEGRRPWGGRMDRQTGSLVFWMGADAACFGLLRSWLYFDLDLCVHFASLCARVGWRCRDDTDVGRASVYLQWTAPAPFGCSVSRRKHPDHANWNSHCGRGNRSSGEDLLALLHA